VIYEALLALVVAAAGAGLVTSSPSGPADPVAGRVSGLVEVGVQAADLVDGEWDELAGIVAVCDVRV
jgi:hypothetical protein